MTMIHSPRRNDTLLSDALPIEVAKGISSRREEFIDKLQVIFDCAEYQSIECDADGNVL